ncbi:MAG: hypothetical protein KAJ19_27875, partial [Gammaproteobacteria bacterium]|nr:hypothetical protein [Gammaproteobacteria bacterium]
IVFTDKKVYSDWVVDYGKTSENVTSFNEPMERNWALVVYAVVLDEDGNMIKGLTNLTGNFKDVQRMDHYHKAGGLSVAILTHHNTTTTNGNFYNMGFALSDDASTTYDTANDGIYTAFLDPDPDPDGSVLIDDHLLFDINVTVGSSISNNVSILLTYQACHNTNQLAHGTHTGTDATKQDNCVICHPGYEHLYEKKSGFTAIRDVHGDKMTPVDPTLSDKGITFVWNISSRSGVLDLSDGLWSVWAPGSEYCYSCHFESGNMLDYGSGDRTTLTDKPSCNVASKTLNAGTVTCHDVTNIEGAIVPPWTQPGATAANHGFNENTYKEKSHNHTGNSPNVSCALCHVGWHGVQLPNISTAGYSNINNQCYTCHGTTGPQSSPVFAHSAATTDCASCHVDGSNKLDAHFVPVGKAGGWNCTECHDGTGNQNVNIDVMNNTGYNHLSLNSNATVAAGARDDNKMCYACHSNSTVAADGKTDYTELPGGEHPANYEAANAKRCTECHTGSGLYGAPIVSEHYTDGTDLQTKNYADANDSCIACHNKAEMQMTSGDTGSSSLGNASHYGTNRTDIVTADVVDCEYCHKNDTTAFATEMVNP